MVCRHRTKNVKERKMNNIKNFVLILSIVALGALAFFFYKTSDYKSEILPQQIFNDEVLNKPVGFSDGLVKPDSVTRYPLDEFDTGLSEKTIYYVDINKDGNQDRITKSFIETGNAHSYYKYKIELNDNGKYVDITPDGLQTTNGDVCDLQQIQFKFKPYFKIIMIYRPMGNNWNEPTVATKKVFTLDGKKFKTDVPKQIRPICDVKELF